MGFDKGSFLSADPNSLVIGPADMPAGHLLGGRPRAPRTERGD